jgi:hypothetical protein
MRAPAVKRATMSSRDAFQILGGGSHRRVAVFELNRVCDHSGCGTVLSRYNPDATCETHKSSDREKAEKAQLLSYFRSSNSSPD